MQLYWPKFFAPFFFSIGTNEFSHKAAIKSVHMQNWDLNDYTIDNQAANQSISVPAVTPPRKTSGSARNTQSAWCILFENAPKEVFKALQYIFVIEFIWMKASLYYLSLHDEPHHEKTCLPSKTQTSCSATEDS